MCRIAIVEEYTLEDTERERHVCETQDSDFYPCESVANFF